MSARALVVAAVLAGCKGGEGDGGKVFHGADYAPPPGMEIELVPPDHGEVEPMLLHVTADTWELRAGVAWDTAEQLATLTVGTDKGLVVNDVTLLADRFELDDAGDGSEVVDYGPRTVWYGTFPEALTVNVSEGAFEGEAAFAEGIGPIHLRFRGALWDLAGYTPP